MTYLHLRLERITIERTVLIVILSTQELLVEGTLQPPIVASLQVTQHLHGAVEKLRKEFQLDHALMVPILHQSLSCHHASSLCSLQLGVAGSP
jgi:hypothetical protein